MRVDIAVILILSDLLILIWPISSGQHFDIEIDGNHGVTLTLLELLHPLLRHLDILEHDLKPLRELEPTFFLDLFDDLPLSVLQDAS